MAKEKSSKSKKESKIEKERNEFKDKYLRTMADFDNYRKRKEKELEQSRDRAIISFVQEILPSIDNFEMSLKMTNNSDMFIKGVEMIHKNLLDALKEHHFEEFEPKVGEEFNPDKHDPLLIEDKKAEPGRVLAVVKKGYLMKKEVIRPAKVQIKKVE
jgi:molecular chaperone GrpE